ncbi:hypothetical protein GWA01_09520 [Gluconobacter wancherniae NBRC 103581]|uniref:Uncharacterized protein n=1 Tax=Gluconobacter wancherniae NBRC 103581 TaxID=656744 RepID=A0A511B039_9PROT|nr:hypothetical protein AA103581_2065 [Gluconobacter wancherniae NBRC 103581]GEK93182.1 hypothetical protein GWA01_09520 [Gluconobacter wancherniae NBRC 103581]
MRTGYLRLRIHCLRWRAEYAIRAAIALKRLADRFTAVADRLERRIAEMGDGR